MYKIKKSRTVEANFEFFCLGLWNVFTENAIFTEPLPNKFLAIVYVLILGKVTLYLKLLNDWVTSQDLYKSQVKDIFQYNFKVDLVKIFQSKCI